nr:uncharacterized protein LOC128703004 isoform X3 [Cherax quadricarinatus]
MILPRQVLESCEGGRPNEVTIEVSHDVTSTDTDSGMSGGAKESHRGRRKRGEVSEAGSEGSEERSLTPPHHPDQRPPTVSPDQGVVTDDCWASAVTGDGAPLQFKIEEHVEEITTHRLTDDDDQDLDCAYDNDVSDSGGSWRGSRCSLDDSRETRHHKVSHHSVTEDPLLSTINVALPDPAHISDRRVSFPELGADIIHDFCSDVDCCDVGPGDMVLNSDTWEENWLFRRQRLMGASASDPVTMLIPNPEAHVPATVGNRDIDELSELSEQQSIGSGEPWSMSESDGEGECMKSCQPSTASRELSTLAGEIVAEFAQQDQEYTVDYSVPIRVTATCRAQQSRKHLASPQASPTHSHKSPEAQPSTRFIYTNHKGVLRNYHEGKTVEGVKNPGVAEKSQVDLDFVSDNERPVPKPRKLSLATKSSTNTSANSSVQLLLSPAEDLTILSPPLEVPDPSNTSSKSETVWFVETPEDCVVMQGRTLRLACQVNTKKPMGVSWYHNGSLVAVGGRDQWVYRQGPFYHLHVYGMTSVAAGLYATAAYTATNCVWAFCRVQYKANSRPQKRPTFTKGLSDVILEEGGDLYLQCQVQGHPEPRVIFSRGLERLEPSSRLAIESDQYGTWTLRLAECSASDSGEITATAASMLSAVNTHCRVKVVPEGTPIPQQVHTNSARLQPSALQTNKQQDPRPGGRHTHKKHNPGSHPPNTSRPTSDNLLISAKTSTPSHREKLTKSSGFNTDTDDLDDIHQVPTKPGIPVNDVCISIHLPAVNNEDIVTYCSITTDVDNDLSSSVLLDNGGASECKPMVHEINELSHRVEDRNVLDSSTSGNVSTVAHGDLSTNTYASLKNLQDDFSNSSSFFKDSYNPSLTRLISSSGSSFIAANHSLDCYSSSHDDEDSSSSNRHTLPVQKLSNLEFLSSSSPVTQNLKARGKFLVNCNASLPLTADQPHAFSTFMGHHQEHGEPSAKPASSFIATSPTFSGTIAEREHRKWEAAVSIPNNPYAPERLVQRLSHTHISEHIPPPRRAISIEFPEESGQELDPSLRDGVPPTPDLNRYSRDYYVTSTTGRRTSSLNFRHQKSHHYHHHHQQQQQQQQTLVQQNNDNQQKEHRHQQEDQQILHKSEILFSANGHKVPRRTSPTLSTNVQEPLHIIGSGLQKNHKSNSEATLHQLRNTQVETSQPSDWKDELRDIQAARVEREVARFQRTINETQRRWEENYARHAPRSVHANGQSDSSTEVLHNPRVDAYLVPRRHDLWRTVSEDTIAVQPRDRTVLQPLLRHTSADNLQPSAKVSNLHNLGSVPLHNMSSMNSVGSMSNININSLTGLGKRTNYQHHSKFGRSVESVSTYSEGDSHGEGLDSDASIRTPEEVPALPSVRKLASKFDLASQERVNDLDKHGKANIFMIEKSAPSDQPYSRSFINNLNKRTEKPYVVKEVRSLASGEGSRPSPETDMYESDVDSTEFDDEATVTSLSLPPTPGSLSDKHSLSNSSLIDTDSCFSTDCRDSNVTTSYDQSSNKTIFGVTLRKTTTNPYGSFDKRKQTSLSSISSVEEVQRASSRVSSHNNRHSWNTSTDDLEREVTPSDCDSDASNRKFYYGSMSDLSNEESVKLKDQKQFHSSFDLSSISRSLETEHCVGPLQVNTKGIKQRETIQQKNKQAGTASVCLLSGSAFAPKGKRRMSDFLNSYVGHKSIHDLNRIDEKTEEDTNNQRYRVAYKTQSHSVSDLPKEPLKKNDALKRSVREDTSKRSVREDTSKRSVSEDTSERSVSEDTSKRSVSEDTSERSVNEDASKRSVGEDTSKSEDTCKKSESEDTYTKPETEGSFKSIDKNASGQENNNDIQVRLKEPKNKTVSEVNGITQQPFLNYLEKAENSLQTSGQDTLDSFAFVSQESVDSSKAVNSSDSQSLELSQMSNADVWDGASFIHTSDDTNTGTLIKSTDNDQFKIDLNEAYISTFYNQLVVDNSQSLTKSTVDTLPVGDSPVTLSKGGKEETVISTTNVHPVQKRRSIGDFLKGYTNISSLDEKTTFNKVTIPKNANTETNLTLIAVSDSNVNMQPQDQSVPASRANVLVSRASVPASGANVPASRAGVPESRASVPASRAGVPASRANVPASRASVPSGASVQNVVMQNAKQSPISSKESTNMTNKNHNHNESTEPQHLGNEIQTPKNNHPDEKFSYTTDKCTVITLSGKEPSLSDASSSVYHANIIYVGDNMKNNHGKDTVQSSTLDKASKNTSDMDPVSMHTNISSIKDSVDVTARHSQSEHKFVSQSVQPVVAGKNPVVNDKKLDHSQDLLQVNDVRKDDDQSSTGPYVTVIAVSDLSDSSLPSYKANVTSSSENSSDDELLLDDPVALTRMIVHNSRIGNSNSKNLRGLKKIDLTKASVPANSPFSPLRSKSSSLICDSSVVDNVPQKKHVGPRDSCDEGVHSQLSDIEVASSGTSMESKSLGSLETCGEDGHDAMVQCS